MDNFNSELILPLFIPMYFNLCDIVVVLLEVIHPLNINLVLRTAINLGYVDDELE